MNGTITRIKLRLAVWIVSKLNDYMTVKYWKLIKQVCL